MAFPFPAEPSALLAERRAQCIALGIPASTVDKVAAGLGHELWADEPGSWVREWSQAASAAEGAGDLLLAALCFGMAKYPCLGSPAHVAAYDEQLRTYLAAAPGFPVAFERRGVTVDYRGSTTDVAVHLFHPRARPDDRPVVLMLGGVDTWKMDIHHSLIEAVVTLDATVVALDDPGVGESRLPSRPDGDRVLAGVVAAARGWGDGRVGIAGWSFGATWAVKLALTGTVDAAMANGAPVDAAFDPAVVARWPNGMTGIMGNSLHRDTPFPDAAAAADALSGFRLGRQGLLDDWGADPTPLLVVNGADDPYVPQTDVTVFDTRPHTLTRLEPHATHCAAEKAQEINPWALGWLRERLDTQA